MSNSRSDRAYPMVQSDGHCNEREWEHYNMYRYDKTEFSR